MSKTEELTDQIGLTAISSQMAGQLFMWQHRYLVQMVERFVLDSLKLGLKPLTVLSYVKDASADAELYLRKISSVQEEVQKDSLNEN